MSKTDKTLNFFNYNLIEIFRAGMYLRINEIKSLVNYLLKGLYNQDLLLRHSKKLLKISGVNSCMIENASAQILNLLNDLKYSDEPYEIQVDKIFEFINDPNKNSDEILRIIRELKTAQILNMSSYRIMINLTFTNLGINLIADS